MVVCVLYAYCQSYSDLRGYSNKGDGGRVVVCVLYAYCQARVTLTYADTLTRGGMRCCQHQIHSFPLGTANDLFLLAPFSQEHYLCVEVLTPIVVYWRYTVVHIYSTVYIL